MYRNWCYFVTNLPPANEVPTDHPFQWPTEPVYEKEEKEEEEEGWFDSYENAQDVWEGYEDDDDRMFRSEDLVWGELSEELPGPLTEDDDDDDNLTPTIV